MLIAPPISIVLAGLLLEVASAIIVLGLIGCIVTVAGLLALMTPLWHKKEIEYTHSDEAPPSQ